MYANRVSKAIAMEREKEKRGLLLAVTIHGIRD